MSNSTPPKDRDVLVPAKCPNCEHLSKYWYSRITSKVAQCHLCESFIAENNIIVC